MSEARTNASDQDTGIRALRVIEHEVYIVLLIIFICAQPTIILKPENVTYTGVSCEITDSNAFQANLYSWRAFKDRLAYDDSLGQRMVALMDGEPPKMPFWWWLWHNYARGLAEGAKLSFPCSPDLRALATDLNTQSISDPLLLDETQAFYRDCWRPCLNYYYRDKPDLPAGFDPARVNDDISWPGSRLFLQLPKYYPMHTTQEPLKSFPYNAERDSSMLLERHSRGRGMPSCQEWWSDPEYGLRVRLLKETDLESNVNWRYWARKLFRSENTREAKDALLRSLLASDAIVRQSRITNTYPREAGGGEAFKNDLSMIGLLWEAPSLYAKTHVLKKAAPIVQAILLMFGIMVLPILLVVGEYSIKTVISLTLLFFSIHFWSFLFAAADWVDNNLWDALETAGYASGYIFGSHIGVLNTEKVNLSLIVDFITLAMYLGLPIIFTVLMSAVGSRAGEQLGRMMGEGQFGSTAAGGAGGGGVKAVKTIATKGKG